MGRKRKKEGFNISKQQYISEFLFQILFYSTSRGIEKEYNTIGTNYQDAALATGHIAREIEKKSDAGDRVDVQQPDYSKPRSVVAIKFTTMKKVDGAEDRQ